VAFLAFLGTALSDTMQQSDLLSMGRVVAANDILQILEANKRIFENLRFAESHISFIVLQLRDG
jgi:hypothetical protein